MHRGDLTKRYEHIEISKNSSQDEVRVSGGH